MSDASTATPASTLTRTRIVWGAFLLGLLVLAALLLLRTGFDPANSGPASLGPVRVVVLALGSLLLGAPVAYFSRLQAYKRGWQGFAVKPEAFFLGNVILFAVLEAVTALCLVLGTLGDQGPCWGIAFIAFLTLVINFPTGKPMEPSEPRL